MDKLLAPLLTDGDVERRWGKKHGYMSSLRARGLGPAFLRLGPRTFRYRPESVVAYEDQQEFDSSAAAALTDFKAPSPFEDVEAPVNRRNAPVPPNVNPAEKLNDFKKLLVRTAKPRTNGV